MQNTIKIHPMDNVAVAVNPLEAGAKLSISGDRIRVSEAIPAGHKMALRVIVKGELVIKYGSGIGRALTDISAGQWVHTHNMKTTLEEAVDYEYSPDTIEETHREDVCFSGFRRSNGLVGVRNEIWIIPTVGCVNNVASAIAQKTKAHIRGTVEDVIAFGHPYGCSQMGDDQENTRKILSCLVNHPNAGGVLVLGLGCENSNTEVLKKYIGTYNPDRVKFLECQQSEDEVEDAHRLLLQLIDYACKEERVDIHASELVIGLKCGGSDGFSGITANPVVGRFSDMIVSAGGTAILTEVPEMFGAEKLLMNRCANADLFQKTVDMINEYKNYFTASNQTIYENPSPGNKEGGISSLEDKSLGCIQKSGTATVKDVLKYGDTVKKKGLNLLSAPGNDLVASTALAAAGAHIVLFTTGRGTPFASPVPTVKISSNSALSGKKANWIDFNAGRVLEGKTIDGLAAELFDFVLLTACGQKVKSEEAGYHDMAIFKQGVTL